MVNGHACRQTLDDRDQGSSMRFSGCGETKHSHKKAQKAQKTQKQTPLWSAAAWRRFGLDEARSITKRRQAAALQRGAQSSRASEKMFPRPRIPLGSSDFFSVAIS